MLIWTLMTYAMMLVGLAGVAGELTGSDLWSLVVEAEKDAPNRRITPKHLFSTPNHNRNRAEQCQQGFRYDHMGKCVPVKKPEKIDLQSELANLRKRVQIRKPEPQLTSELPSSSTGPYFVSIPLANKITTAKPYPTTTSESPFIDNLRITSTSTAISETFIPILTTQPDSSTESLSTITLSSSEKDTSTSLMTSTEKVPLVISSSTSTPDEETTTSSITSTEKGTISISTSKIKEESTTSATTTTEKELNSSSTSTIEKETTTENESIKTTTALTLIRVESLSNETESLTNPPEQKKPNLSSLPSAITNEYLIETSTVAVVEGSGKEEVEGSGFEGSGFAAPVAEEVNESSTTVRYIDNRPLRSTTLVDETTTDYLKEESTLATPTTTKPSVLLSLLKGDLKSEEATEKTSIETTTQYPSTTTESIDNTEWLPIVEYVDIDFPKGIEKNKSFPNENIELKYTENTNMRQPNENVELKYTENTNMKKPNENVEFKYSENTNKKKPNENIELKYTENSNMRQPNKNIDLKYTENTNVNSPIEVSKREPLKQSQPVVLFFDFKKNDEFPDETKVLPDIDSFADEWVKEIPSPWVRFPNNYEEPSRRQEFSASGSGFRFPEEVVQPEHRPTLLKFWSKIPMYQSDSNFRRQYSDLDGF